MRENCMPVENAFFHRWELFANLLKFNLITELNVKINWQILV